MNDLKSFDFRYKYFAYPRLYVKDDLRLHSALSLSESQTHYLKNVLRKGIGDHVRFFNGRGGEWLGRITVVSKKALSIDICEHVATQPAGEKRVHLFFAPLKKNRMDILIEKAVELGVTDLHPIITKRSDVRKINEKRIRAQILEAAEQCERFTIPALYDLQSMERAVCDNKPEGVLYFCSERCEDDYIGTVDVQCGDGFIVGPPGGFDETECAFITSHDHVQSISLGKVIYRAETASIVCLVHAQGTN